MIFTAANSFDTTVQMSTENQQSTMPVYAVSQQHFQYYYGSPSAKSFMFLFTSQSPSSIFTSMRVGSIGRGPSANKMPSLQFSSTVELLPFPFSSFVVNSSIREQCSENFVPNFSFQNSIFITQACDFKGYPFNTDLGPNPTHMNRNSYSYDPTYGVSNLGPQSESVKPKRLYRCEPCRVQFHTPQAFGGHMSHHSKTKKAREMEKREEDANPRPTNSKKPKIASPLNKEPKLEMDEPVKLLNIVEEGDGTTEFDASNENKLKKEGEYGHHHPFGDPKMKNDSIEADNGSLIFPKEQIDDFEFNEIDYMDLSSFFGI